MSPTMLVAVQTDLVRYYRQLADRVEQFARVLSPEKFWTRPFAFGNSVGHLILHLTGNLSHYIGARMAGTGYVRDRPLEFSDTTKDDPAKVLARFKTALDTVTTTIDDMDESAFVLPITDYEPITTRFGLLLVCASHMNNHVGQMAYLVQALGHTTNDPRAW